MLLSYVNNKGADQPAHPRSLISAFVVRCLDSNEILARLAHTLYFAESVLSLHVHLVKSEFHPAGTVYTDSVSLCRLFCDKSF